MYKVAHLNLQNHQNKQWETYTWNSITWHSYVTPQVSVVGSFDFMLRHCLLSLTTETDNQLYGRGHRVRAANTAAPRPAWLLAFRGETQCQYLTGWRCTALLSWLQRPGSNMSSVTFSLLQLNTKKGPWEAANYPSKTVKDNKLVEEV